MLSPEIQGMMTHWIGSKSAGRSQHCQGDGNCPDAWHKGDCIWKGYVASYVFDESKLMWFPFVLEITEHLELDLRGQYRRGQIWAIAKKPNGKKKVAALCGQLLETVDQVKVPPTFDILAVLKWTYHVQNLCLGAVSRMPAKIIVAPEVGYIPQSIQPSEAELLERQAVEEHARRALEERIKREKEIERIQKEKGQRCDKTFAEMSEEKKKRDQEKRG